MIVVFFQDMPHYWYEKVTPVSRFIPTFGASSVSQISSLEKKITKEKRCKSKKKRTLLQLSKVKWSACPLLLLIIWSLHWGKKVKHFDGTKVFFSLYSFILYLYFFLAFAFLLPVRLHFLYKMGRKWVRRGGRP